MNNLQVITHITRLKDSNSSVRSSAAKMLEEIGDTSAIPALVATLHDQDSGIQFLAGEALKKICDASHVPLLIASFENLNAFGCILITSVLEKIGVPAVPALNEAFQTRDKQVRKYAPALNEALHAREKQVRKYATLALERIGDVSAVPALIEALKDSDPSVRSGAASAMKKIGDSVTLPRKLLAASQFSVQQRIELLDALRRVRFQQTRYIFPGIRTLCQTVIDEGDVDVGAGASAVLQWLNGHDLVRASQRDPANEPQELLRASLGGTSESQPETLLRGAEEPDKNAGRPPQRRTLRERLFGKRKDEVK